MRGNVSIMMPPMPAILQISLSDNSPDGAETGLVYLPDHNQDDALVIVAFYEDWGYIICTENCLDLSAFHDIGIQSLLCKLKFGDKATK